MKSKSFTISPPRETYHPRQQSPRNYINHSNNQVINSNSSIMTTPVISDPILINSVPSVTTSNSVNNHLNTTPQVNVSRRAAEKISKKIKCLKTILTIYLILVFTFEIAWTYFIVKFQLEADLRSYHENWDNVWIKEFYKSTKNFFLFILILLILAIAIGLASVMTSNKHLAQTFIAVLLIEWIFEFIGVYASKDRNILIYRLVPCTLRPGLLTLMFMFIKSLNQEDEEYCKDINKHEEEGQVTRHLAIQAAAAQQQQQQQQQNMTQVSSVSNGGSTNGTQNKSNNGDVSNGETHVTVIPITSTNTTDF